MVRKIIRKVGYRLAKVKSDIFKKNNSVKLAATLKGSFHWLVSCHVECHLKRVTMAGLHACTVELAWIVNEPNKNCMPPCFCTDGMREIKSGFFN